MTRFFLLFVIFMFFSAYQLAYAEQKIGQVVWVQGSVQSSSSSGTPHALQRRSAIYEHDTITTGASGSGEIVFTDNSIVTLRADTTFKVDQYKFNPNTPNDNKYVASVAKGGFRTITGLISKAHPDNYQVNTPVATIGVRGTDYSLFYSVSSGLQVKLSQGRISLVNPAGRVDLDVGQKKVFATIRDIKTRPVITNKPSAVFKTQPAITPAAISSNGVVTQPVTTAPVGKVIQVGPTKPVSGFCIQ